MLLAIDTSTDTAGLALIRDNEILTELTWRCEQSHTVTVLPYLASLLGQTGVELQAIKGIIVAKGPGSFNGLRVGISTAKGLAFGLGVPLVGISTLEVAAYQHAITGLPVCPILNAGRGEIATAIYHMKRGKWQPVISEHITTTKELCTQVSTKTIFCGELTSAICDELKKRLKHKAVLALTAARMRRAGFLAELGQRQMERGDFSDPAALQPIYLRRPHITKPKRAIKI